MKKLEALVREACTAYRRALEEAANSAVHGNEDPERAAEALEEEARARLRQTEEEVSRTWRDYKEARAEAEALEREEEARAETKAGREPKS